MDKLISNKQAPTPKELAEQQALARSEAEARQVAAIDFQLRVTCMGQAASIFQGTSTDSSNVIKMAEAIYTQITGKEWKQD